MRRRKTSLYSESDRSSTDSPLSLRLRRRSPVTAEPKLTRAEGLWFEDCGLIIRAESTIYRVSSAVLAMQSVVFRDMLSMPTPMDAEMMDGCPFVSLPDSAEDITNFLKTIFCYGFFDPAPAPTTFDILCSVLRMSHKYEVDELRKRALAHLSQAHPTTLEDWDNLEELPSWKTDSSEPMNSDRNIDQNVMTVIVARQVGATWILPTAFYRMCQDSLEESVVMNDALDNSDTVNFIKGLRYLETTGVSDVLQFLTNKIGRGCFNICGFQQHYDKRDEIRLGLEKRKGYSAENTQVMALELWSADDWNKLDPHACQLCIYAMKKNHNRMCQKLWDKLPETFGLPSWEELRKMKADALELE